MLVRMVQYLHSAKMECFIGIFSSPSRPAHKRGQDIPNENYFEKHLPKQGGSRPCHIYMGVQKNQHLCFVQIGGPNKNLSKLKNSWL